MTFKLTLIRGLPGSGKSTLAKSLNVNHYEADMYFMDEAGSYCFKSDEIAQAHQWCQTMTSKSLAKKQSVVVSNTFVRRWEMTPYLKLANRYGAKFEVIECKNDFGNIHGVEPATIQQMKKRWQEWQSVPQLSK
ncbi:ATP-binding protein [Vibrio japonicus]|uniref:ATP-binding protein n=1 Tax=Vibrio japonicus TaxID=1824638 RepID=A0ABY5LBR0_9VIBR|nr:ATP-binding protein [Vibrio japonicus]UUM29492.1 ATP-binding protein [Vibrio japonicus]